MLEGSKWRGNVHTPVSYHRRAKSDRCIDSLDLVKLGESAHISCYVDPPEVDLKRLQLDGADFSFPQLRRLVSAITQLQVLELPAWTDDVRRIAFARVEGVAQVEEDVLEIDRVAILK